MPIADLTSDDLDAYRAGRLTHRDLAAKAGVSRQRIGAWLKRAGRKAADGDQTPSATNPAPAISGLTSGQPADGTGHPGGAFPPDAAVDAEKIATRANLGLLVAAHNLLATSSGSIGPSMLKALATTVATASAELRQLGVLAPKTDSADAPEMTIRVMSEDEERALQEKLEQEFADRGFVSGGEEDYGPEEVERQDETPTDEATDTPPVSSTPTHTVPDDLRERLAAFGHHNGAAVLRQLAIEVGAETPRAAPALADALAERAQVDEAACAAILRRLRA